LELAVNVAVGVPSPDVKERLELQVQVVVHWQFTVYCPEFDVHINVGPQISKAAYIPPSNPKKKTPSRITEKRIFILSTDCEKLLFS